MVSRRSRSLVLPPLEDWVGETPTTILSATCRGSEKAVRPSHMANSLFQAVQNTRFKRVQVLLDQGLRLRQLRNEARENVLMVSLKAEDEARREKMFSYLIKRGADPTYVHPSSGRDVLIWAVCRSCPRQVSQLLDLTGGDLDLLSKDNQGFTALHYATMKGDRDSVQAITEALQKYHLSVDVCDDQGLTPYIHAMRLGHYDIGEFLVKNGYASPLQADKHTFKDANAWVEEGIRERKRLSKERERKESIQRKINGRLPEIRKQKLPQIECHDFGDNQTAFPTVGDRGLSERVRGYYNRDGIAERKVGRSLTGEQQVGWQSKLRVHSNAALNLMEDASAIRNATHVFEFKSSKFDTTKRNELRNFGINVTVLMDSLSAQTTNAFRKTAAEPQEYRKKPTPTPEIKKKEKISTLAILMGKVQTKSQGKKKEKKRENCKKKVTTERRKSKKVLLPPI